MDHEQKHMGAPLATDLTTKTHENRESVCIQLYTCVYLYLHAYLFVHVWTVYLYHLSKWIRSECPQACELHCQDF